MSQVYRREIDQRLVPVVDHVLARARLKPGERVLDLGTGTGAVAEKAALAVGAEGHVLAVDPSPEMLALAERRSDHAPVRFEVVEGSAESLPADDGSVDVTLASLSLMFVIDRAAAAREMARVLRPGGCLVAAVWGSPEECDLVLFQRTVGQFAPKPPVPGVGPGALADPQPFLEELRLVGIAARVETELTGFDFPNLPFAWDVLAGVMSASLTPELQRDAQQAIQDTMWPDPSQPRHFSNLALFIVGVRA
ncbi:MAG: class I SAM-dependent methyltransferase [Candidatus Limnocylindria bacterium]